jgi:uncharacterized protein YjbJ (UPF0337 family)
MGIKAFITDLVIKKNLEINMILFHRIRKALMTVGLVVLLATVITFSFVPGKSWANPLLTPSLDQPHALVATMDQAKAMTKNVEGKAQEEMGNITGDLKTQAAGKAKQFDANTQEAILESINNPNYQPDRQKTMNRDRNAVRSLEEDVRDNFDQTQGPD